MVRVADTPPIAVAASLSLIQISDLHLSDDPAQQLRGFDFEASFDRVLDHLRRRHPERDAVVASGDLTHDGGTASYCRLREKLLTLDCPIHLLPGNHDQRDAIETITGGPIHFEASAELGGWQLLLLDTSLPGHDEGAVTTEELERLEHNLAQHPGCHALLFLHHHPVASGSRWLDQLGLRNPEPLFALLDRYPRLRAISWGHTHQAYEGVRNGVRLFSAPSTGSQFRPDSEQFALDSSPDSGRPGYRWFRLYENGEIESGVERVELD